MMLIRAVGTSTLLFFCGVALAQLGPNVAKPDPRIGAVAFNKEAPVSISYSMYEGKAEISVPHGVQASGAEAGMLCRYDMTVTSYNYGPGDLTADDQAKLVVGVKAKLPDGSVVESQGKLCLSQVPAPMKGGSGCSGTETVFLPAGTTELTWTLDPGGQISQDYEDANVVKLFLTVPSPCTSKGEIALAKQPDAPRPPSRGIEAARDNFSKGWNFTRAIKPAKAPARSPRTAPSSSPGTRRPPQ